MKHFYSHLVETDSILLELDELELTRQEKKHLISLMDETLRHKILDAILSELTDEDKKIFLTHVAAENNEEIWKLLNSKAKNIEEKIKKAAEDLKKELHEDIRKTKRQK